MIWYHIIYQHMPYHGEVLLPNSVFLRDLLYAFQSNYNQSSKNQLNNHQLWRPFNQETSGMLYSPAHIILSIAHFDFISDYTMFWTAARESGITHSHPIMPGTIWILEFLLQAKGKVSFVSFSFRGQKTILCMIYFWKFSKLMPQEDWKIRLTHDFK